MGNIDRPKAAVWQKTPILRTGKPKFSEIDGEKRSWCEVNEPGMDLNSGVRQRTKAGFWNINLR
jgi:hypothetical protein